MFAEWQCLIKIKILWTTWGHVDISLNTYFNSSSQTQFTGQYRNSKWQMATFIVKCSDVVYDVQHCGTDCENTFSYSHVTLLFEGCIVLRHSHYSHHAVQNILWRKKRLWETEAGIPKRMFQKKTIFLLRSNMQSREHVLSNVK